MKRALTISQVATDEVKLHYNPNYQLCFGFLTVVIIILLTTLLFPEIEFYNAINGSMKSNIERATQQHKA